MLFQVASISARLIAKIDVSLEKDFWRWGSTFVAVFLACSISTDIRSKLWIDELFTLHVAKQMNLVEIARAIIEGSDGQPPLYAMIVHLILPLVRDEALAVRLPSTLAYCAMVLCLLAFCRRRLSASYSFFASLLACDACLYYSTDGRAYGMVLGCAAGALLCWQMAAEGRHRGVAVPLLALCLGLMISLHFYSIFFLFPLFLAELVRFRETRKPDFPILFAMASTLLVLGLHYPIIQASNQFIAHFWSPASLEAIEPYYTARFFPLLQISSLAFFAIAVSPKTPTLFGTDRPPIPPHEWVVMGAFALMPTMVIFFSTYVTHVFAGRYILWSVMGFALLTGAVLFTAVRGQVANGVILFGFLVLLIGQEEIWPLFKTAGLRESAAAYKELELLPAGPELIVIPNTHVFMELSYYAEQRLRSRLIYPLSRDLDVRFRGTDTDAILLSALSGRAPIRVKDYDAILAENPRFLLVAATGDYLPWYLVASGYRVMPIRRAGLFYPAGLLYEVEAPKKE